MSDEYHEAMKYGTMRAVELKYRHLAHCGVEEAREITRGAQRKAHEALSNLYDLETEMSVLLQLVSGVLRIHLDVYGGTSITKQHVDEALREIRESQPGTLTDMIEMAKKIGAE